LGQVSLHLITTEAWLDETKTGVPDWWSRVISIVIVSLFRTGYIAPSLVVASPLWQARCGKPVVESKHLPYLFWFFGYRKKYHAVGFVLMLIGRHWSVDLANLVHNIE